MQKENQSICPICNERLSLFKETLQDGIRICFKHMAEAGVSHEDWAQDSEKIYSLEEIKARRDYIRTNTGGVSEGKQTVCPICKDILTMSRVRLQGGIKICEGHLKEAGISYNKPNLKPISTFTLEEIVELIRLDSSADAASEIFNQDFSPVPVDELKTFNRTKQIGQSIAVDDENKKWAILSPVDGEIRLILPYSAIFGYEWLEDGKTIEKKGLGRAVAGGLLFGVAGAAVGAMTTAKEADEICHYLRIKIDVDDINRPVVYVDIITEKVSKETVAYREAVLKAQEITSILQYVIEKNNRENSKSGIPVEEIKKLKELLDLEIITEEEFLEKKKEMLGL